MADDGWAVEIIDQTKLPHAFETCRLETLDDAARAIRDMLVRGAPLIGATAAYGLALAMRADPSTEHLERAGELLFATRPTAVNLRWALEDVTARLRPLASGERGQCPGAHRTGGAGTLQPDRVLRRRLSAGARSCGHHTTGRTRSYHGRAAGRGGRAGPRRRIGRTCYEGER